MSVAAPVLGAASAWAVPPGTIEDESKVPPYTLPDPLKLEDGQPVRDARSWNTRRRKELIAMMEREMYGRAPGRPAAMGFEQTSIDSHALNGKAVRKEITVTFNSAKSEPKMNILLYLPADAKGPVPVFAGLGFGPNHTVHADPGIAMSQHWVARPSPRGAAASRWQVEMLLRRGYGVAHVYCGDLVPDRNDGLKDGVPSLYFKTGQTAPASDEWGAVAAWAWGLSRTLDYLETDKHVDAKRVTVIGHSRLGKAAVWAGALDERFAMVVSNDSGCCGAALSKRIFGETVKNINDSFPHWFCANFKKYSGNEKELPFDQHEVLSLVAPRPLYVASAAEDLWADPEGEFLGAKLTAPVYRLFGKPGLAAEKRPPLDKPVQGLVSYHVRTGKHDITDFDWKCYLDAADLNMRRP